jgi:OFA family oxalate/formate antiporter-like MFS transporter
MCSFWPAPHRPFAPARLPFFYGWVVVGLGTLAVACSIPGQTMGVSVFTDFLLEATGLSRLQLSTAYLFGTLTSGFLLPMGGRLLDRRGARLVGGGAALALALTLVALSFLGHLTPRITEASTNGRVVLVFAVMTAGFAVLRFSGQGMLTLTGRTMVARWFHRRRGLVAGVFGALVSFAFSLAPLVLLAWIATSGWRGAWREMALALVCMAAIAFVFFRDSPEQCGLQMDGDSAPREHTAGAGEADQGGDVAVGAPTAGRDSTHPEALASHAFWLLTLVVAADAMMSTALTFHIVDLGAEGGLSEAQAVGIFLPIAIISVSLGFLVGWLVDRQPILRLVQAMAILEVVMFAAAGHLDSPFLRVVAIVAWGCVGGFYAPLTAAALPKLFGRLHLGAIAGSMTMVLVLGSALGPAYLAWFSDATGSYRTGLHLSAAIPLLLLAATFRRSEPAPGGEESHGGW